MNFKQAHLRREVKLAGSPRRSRTSAWRVEMKKGVVTPSRRAISSKVAQNAFSSRIEVLCPFRRRRRVVLVYRSGSCPAKTSHILFPQSIHIRWIVSTILNTPWSLEFPKYWQSSPTQGSYAPLIAMTIVATHTLVGSTTSVDHLLLGHHLQQPFASFADIS